MKFYWGSFYLNQALPSRRRGA